MDLGHDSAQLIRAGWEGSNLRWRCCFSGSCTLFVYDSVFVIDVFAQLHWTQHHTGLKVTPELGSSITSIWRTRLPSAHLQTSEAWTWSPHPSGWTLLKKLLHRCWGYLQPGVSSLVLHRLILCCLVLSCLVLYCRLLCWLVYSLLNQQKKCFVQCAGWHLP